MGGPNSEILTGSCHCGAVQYSIQANVAGQSLCHCSDCRRHAGAPYVAWVMVNANDVQIQGSPKLYASSEHGRRHFCGDCGTGLFYTNEQILPGIIDVQACTLQNPEALPVKHQIQTAEQLSWTNNLSDIPAFERYPC